MPLFTHATHLNSLWGKSRRRARKRGAAPSRSVRRRRSAIPITGNNVTRSITPRRPLTFRPQSRRASQTEFRARSAVRNAAPNKSTTPEFYLGNPSARSARLFREVRACWHERSKCSCPGSVWKLEQDIPVRFRNVPYLSLFDNAHLFVPTHIPFHERVQVIGSAGTEEVNASCSHRSQPTCSSRRDRASCSNATAVHR